MYLLFIRPSPIFLIVISVAAVVTSVPIHDGPVGFVAVDFVVTVAVPAAFLFRLRRLSQRLQNLVNVV